MPCASIFALPLDLIFSRALSTMFLMPAILFDLLLIQSAFQVFGHHPAQITLISSRVLGVAASGLLIAAHGVWVTSNGSWDSWTLATVIGLTVKRVASIPTVYFVSQRLASVVGTLTAHQRAFAGTTTAILATIGLIGSACHIAANSTAGWNETLARQQATYTVFKATEFVCALMLGALAFAATVCTVRQGKANAMIEKRFRNVSFMYSPVQYSAFEAATLVLILGVGIQGFTNINTDTIAYIDCALLAIISYNSHLVDIVGHPSVGQSTAAIDDSLPSSHGASSRGNHNGGTSNHNGGTSTSGKAV
ncbi:hypothetical protein BC828DRAFT_392156 [Blastocladiella britannica]|nr:hypothetical protein BC828DRAFT_392156 [Blastocladiella britannica]